MSHRYEGPLAFSHLALRALRVANVIYGLGILTLLVMSLTSPDWVLRAIGARPAADGSSLVHQMQVIMICGLAAVPIAHLVLTRLLEIVETVRARDPFVLRNAERLQTIAWSVLVLELLRLVIGTVGRHAATVAADLDIGWKFSFTPYLAVLLLFVLARVFDHGARMRADLEGTV